MKHKIHLNFRTGEGAVWERFVNIGLWLKQNRNRVLQIWEEQVRAVIPPARPVDAPVLTNSIPDLYDKLMDILIDQALPPKAGEVSIGKHGQERSRLRGYDLGFVIEELHILHHVILAIARECRPLEAEEADAILIGINYGVIQAASEFANIRVEQLNHAKQEAEKASDAKSFFLETMSHEIKTPLGVILGNVELLKDSTILERQKHLKAIMHQGHVLSKLIDTSLNLAAAEIIAKVRFSQERLPDHLRILLVDDSLDNQDYIRQLLERKGMEVECACDGREAVEKAKSDFYDIIIMDLQMPVLNGYQATMELRDQGYRKPIVALTAHTTSEDAKRSMNAGCDAHLTKPIDKYSLFRTIHDLQYSLH